MQLERCLNGLLLVLRRFPFDPFEVEYENCVEDRDQEQGDERGDGESADLGIAKRFPERAAFECRGNKARIVAPTVIITGRMRSIPASARARFSGSLRTSWVLSWRGLLRVAG